MKKLINDPQSVVQESVAGFVRAHHELVTLNDEPLFVYQSAPLVNTVGLVSGGGSGHEPLHAGFVGEGMLTAAVPGPVFTSPTPDSILPAIKAADSGAGVLLIVKNYTGDVLNFETAAEFAAAEGVNVRQVLVNDDVAVQDSLYTAGRRGVAGTVLVEKIAGAAAARGDSLDEVTAVAQDVIDNVRSMGVALSAVEVPHSDVPSFDLPDDEIEIGIGIHGEPGRRRAPMTTAKSIAEQLLEPVLTDLGVESGEEVLLFVNGMGGTPLSELHIVFGAAAAILDQKNVKVSRALVGNYVTSLQMQGCSITVLRLNPERTALWDAPVTTPNLRW